MIQPLSHNMGILQTNQLSTLGRGEHVGETENDGDSDDGAKGMAQQSSMRLGNSLPSFLGTRINTTA